MPKWLFLFSTLLFSVQAAEVPWVVLERSTTDEDIVDRMPNLIERGVTHLTVYLAPGVTDAGLTQLARLTSLQELWILLPHQGSRVTAAGITPLAVLPRLKKLRFGPSNSCEFGTDFARSIASLSRLEELEVPYGPINDDVADALSALTNLRALVTGQSHRSCPDQILTDRGVTALERLTNLETLSFTETGTLSITATGLSALGRLPKLKKLVLGENAHFIGADAWQHVSGYESLEELNVGFHHLSEASGAVMATFPRLTSLVLGYYETLNADALRGLSASRTLRKITAGRGETLGPEGWPLLRRFSALKDLTIRYTGVGSEDAPTTLDEDAVRVLTSLTRLEALDVPFEGFDERIVRLLANLTELKSLNLKNVALTDLSFLTNLPRLERLRLGNRANIPLAALATLGRLRSLTHLDLQSVLSEEDRGRDISALVAALADLPRLVALDLTAIPVRDRHMAALGRLPALRALLLRHTNITTDGVDTILGAAPALRVVGVPFQSREIPERTRTRATQRRVTIVGDDDGRAELRELAQEIFGD